MFRQFLESYIFGLDFAFFKTDFSLKGTQKDKIVKISLEPKLTKESLKGIGNFHPRRV